MSSFECSVNHLKTIERGLTKNVDQLNWHALRNHNDQDKIYNLVNDWYKLNQTTVGIQYKQLDKPIDLPVKGIGENTTKLELLKALQCLSYQVEMEQFDKSYKEPKNFIREATEDEKEAYQILQDVINSLSAIVIAEIPEYRAAKWSIN